MAKRILILRHAEKPDDDKERDLSSRGDIRAAALAVALPRRFGIPDYLFATRDTKESCRPRLTLLPLSRETGLPIDCTFENDDYADLAAYLRSERIRKDTTTVVAWHQGKIPELARALDADHVPGDWSDSVFDQIWCVELHDHGKVTTFDILQQELLYGDSPHT